MKKYEYKGLGPIMKNYEKGPETVDFPGGKI